MSLTGALVGSWPALLIATGPAPYHGWMPVAGGFLLGLAAWRPGRWLTGLAAGLVLAVSAYLLLFGWEPGLMAYAAKRSLPLIAAAFAGLAARSVATDYVRRHPRRA